jgi:transcriptional regulator with XRE-family HTH domain
VNKSLPLRHLTHKGDGSCGNRYGQRDYHAGMSDENLALGHFGRQLKKDRLARRWTVAELADRMGVDAAHLSRIENGRRPPTENIAFKADEVFPERRGWYLEDFEDSKGFLPPGFKDWREFEDKAASLRVWSPGVIDGFLQTEAYALGLLETSPSASDEITRGRLASRLERQKRVLNRNDPPSILFIVDQLSLYREVGGAEVMAEQMRHLAEVATRPSVTIQVHPAVAHPASQSGFMITESAAYAEHVWGGFVYDDEQSVTGIGKLFDSLRGECYRVSESLGLIREVGQIWNGERAPTAEQTADSASR